MLAMLLKPRGIGMKNKNCKNPHAKSKKCGARTRAGGSCQQPAMPNGRCRLHGGKTPKGIQNALKHGKYTKEVKQTRKFLREMVNLLRKAAQCVVI